MLTADTAPVVVSWVNVPSTGVDPPILALLKFDTVIVFAVKELVTVKIPYNVLISDEKKVLGFRY